MTDIQDHISNLEQQKNQIDEEATRDKQVAADQESERIRQEAEEQIQQIQNDAQ